MMNYNATAAIVKAHVLNLFDAHAKPELTYHNLHHTQQVVAYAGQIAAAYTLPAEELFILTVAAWFHDTGHLFTTMELHEEKSVELMKEFLHKEAIDTALTNKIAQCIMATKYPPHPATLLEEIICDADTYHFGTPDFIMTDEQVKKEMMLCTHRYFITWDKDTLQLLEKHVFFTAYCREKLAEGKQANIRYLQSKISHP
jgi:predicted metal-dependent HD superfamily phosphohydrolase